MAAWLWLCTVPTKCVMTSLVITATANGFLAFQLDCVTTVESGDYLQRRVMISFLSGTKHSDGPPPGPRPSRGPSAVSCQINDHKHFNGILQPS